MAAAAKYTIVHVTDERSKSDFPVCVTLAKAARMLKSKDGAALKLSIAERKETKKLYGGSPDTETESVGRTLKKLLEGNSVDAYHSPKTKAGRIQFEEDAGGHMSYNIADMDEDYDNMPPPPVKEKKSRKPKEEKIEVKIASGDEEPETLKKEQALMEKLEAYQSPTTDSESD